MELLDCVSRGVDHPLVDRWPTPCEGLYFAQIVAPFNVPSMPVLMDRSHSVTRYRGSICHFSARTYKAARSFVWFPIQAKGFCAAAELGFTEAFFPGS